MTGITQLGLLLCLNVFPVMFLKINLIIGHFIFVIIAISNTINTSISQDEEVKSGMQVWTGIGMSNAETFRY